MLKTDIMWNKIFFGLLGLGTVVSIFFAYYAHSWLQSIGAPAAALDGFYYNSGLGWVTVLISSLALLIVANVVLWLQRHAWAAWTTLLYFAVFTVLWYFWLLPSAREFAFSSNIQTPTSSLTPLSGVVFCLAAAALVYFDQFLVVRLAARMHPAMEPVEDGAPSPQPNIEDEEREKPPIT